MLIDYNNENVDIGEIVVYIMKDCRIVSLIASATEIVCALGLEKYLVGISHECDYPPAIKNLPVCSSSKIEMNGQSYAIDEKVKAIVQESLSIYKVDAGLLESLMPTHIITQYFNRPGPRLVESLKILAEIFHPEIFKPQFEGSGWIRFGNNT